MEKSEEKIISWDPKKEHVYLIQKINEISGYQYTGQEAPLQQAIPYILSVDRNIVGDVLKRAAKTKIVIDTDVGAIPKSIKVRVDKKMCEEADKLFLDTYVGLKRIQRPYFVRVILNAYYLHLLEENKKLGVGGECKYKEKKEDIDNLSRFYLSFKVSEMLLNNRPEDEMLIHEIENIIKKREGK